MTLALGAGGCTQGLFSSIHYPDRSRPVARIETTGGVEYGATTVEGILLLGRTAQEGPCRVSYFLGPRATPMVEDAEIRPAGGGFFVADIDLEHQSVELLEHEPGPQDELVAIVHQDRGTREIQVQLAAPQDITGSALAWPGEPLPAGTGIFTRDAEGRWRFVGLVSGVIEHQAGGTTRRWVAFAGTDRVRELLATPRVHPPRPRVVHRPDDISKVKPVR